MEIQIHFLFLSGASANDIDGEHYNGGSIQVDFDEYFTGDRLVFVDGNGFTSSNGSIALNGVEVATIDASYDGTGKAFKINFTSDSVTDTVVEGLLEQIGYNSVSHNATNSGLLPTRSVSVTLRDGGNEGDSGGEKEITFTPVSNTFDFLTLNDSPLISGLDSAHSTTYIQNGEPVVIDADVVLTDLDLAASETPNSNVNSLVLDGSSDYAEIVDDNALDLTADYTLEAWFKRTGSSNGMILNKEDSYEIAIMYGRIYYALAEVERGWAWQDTGLSVSSDQWNHVALVHSSATSSVTVYLNGGTDAGGSEFTSTTWPGYADTLITTSYSLRIGGRHSGAQWFTGEITDVRIWNEARTATEISAGRSSVVAQRFLRIDR